MKHVKVWATDKLDYGTFRECNGARVQAGIAAGDFCDTHVSLPVCCLALAQETSVLNLFAVVKQNLQVGAERVERAPVAQF